MYMYVCLWCVVDMKVNGLQIVICIEYLMQIKDFFVKGMPATTGAVVPVAAAQKPGKYLFLCETRFLETTIKLQPLFLC